MVRVYHAAVKKANSYQELELLKIVKNTSILRFLFPI